MFREVTMVEITEVLRLWLAGTPKKRIAAQWTPKTGRRYVEVSSETGLRPGTALTDAHVQAVLLALHLAAAGRAGTRGPGVSSSARPSSSGCATACA